MKNKKLAILALALSLIGTVGFAACGDKGGNGNSNSSSGGGNIGVEPEGETLANEAAWRKAMDDTLTATNAVVTYTATMEERMGDYFFIDSGNATAKVADGKVYQTATYTSSFRYPDEETGDVLEGEEDFTNETYISIVDGVAIEWWRENAEEWNCSPYERYEYGFTPTLDGLLTYADINLSYFVESYEAFENVDGTYIFEMAEGGESGKLELKFVNGLLYSYVMESTYAYVEDGETFVESMSISSVITYGNATIGDLPPMTWDGESGGDVGGDDKPSKPEDCEHSFSEYYSNDDATCTKDGTKTAWCDYDCGETDTIADEGSKRDHSFTDYKSDDNATCTEDGTKTAYCDYGCGETDTIKDEDTAGCSYTDGVCGACGRKPYEGLVFSKIPDSETYELTSIGTCTDRRIVIPSEYNSLPVTAIADKAFYENDRVIEIVIPEGVTSIGDSAFWGCGGLKKISIPDSVENVGAAAFNYCNLKYTEKDDLKYLGNENNPYVYLMATDTKSLVVANVEEGCKVIGDNVFSSHQKLTEVHLPDSLISIGFCAFYMGNLTEIEIPKNVRSIEDSAFAYNDLTKIEIPQNVKSIGKEAFRACDIAELVVPDNVTSIGEKAFSNCNALISVTIGNGVTYIRERTFEDCEKLESVIIGDGVLVIEKSAFSQCRKLKTVSLGNSLVSIGDFVFFYCDELTGITIPDSVLSIGEKAFCQCFKLTNVLLGKNLTTIGKSAFESCDLTELSIPDSVAVISKYAFKGCSDLTKVTFGKGLTEIGYESFSGCYTLKTIEYNGTTSEWKKILRDWWYEDVPATQIVCSDGNYGISQI